LIVAFVDSFNYLVWNKFKGMNNMEKYYIWIISAAVGFLIVAPYKFAKDHPSVFLDVDDKIISWMCYIFLGIIIFSFGYELGSDEILVQLKAQSMDISNIKQISWTKYTSSTCVLISMIVFGYFFILKNMAKKIIEHAEKN
jgi:amino acid permease